MRPDAINQRGRFTHQEIGKLMGLSPARVRQIEQRALAKLREAFRKLGLENPFPK